MSKFPETAIDRSTLTPAMWAILLAGLSAAAVWPAMMIRPNEYDSCIFMWMGQRMWSGNLPYRDLWDNKLPLLYWINAAAALTGSPKFAIYLMQVLAVASGGWLVYGIGRRLLDEWPGRVASIAYVTLAGSPAMLGTGNFTETWAAPFVILCIYAMLRYALAPAADHVRRSNALLHWPLLGGLAMGTAISLRQPAVLIAGTLLAMLPVLWRTQRVTAGAILAWLFGLMLVPALMLGWARAAGVSPLMFQQCIAFNFSYGTTAPRPDWANWPSVYARFLDVVRTTQPWHLMAAVGALATAARLAVTPAARRPTADPLPRVGLHETQPSVLLSATLLFAWVATAALSALPSMRFYVHHYYFAAAPLALLAGAAFVPLFSRTARCITWRLLAGVALAAVLAFLAGLHFEQRFTYAARDARYYAHVSRLADFLDARVDRPQDTLYVMAWGAETNILPRLAAASSTKHVMVLFYPELHTGRQMIQQWRDDMIANPPDWLICREDLDLVAGPATAGRWPMWFNWNKPENSVFLDEVHLAYARAYDRVGVFDSANSRGPEQPDPHRLIVYRKRPPWHAE